MDDRHAQFVITGPSTRGGTYCAERVDITINLSGPGPVLTWERTGDRAYLINRCELGRTTHVLTDGEGTPQTAYGCDYFKEADDGLPVYPV
jgi:hypothetical protein